MIDEAKMQRDEMLGAAEAERNARHAGWRAIRGDVGPKIVR
jgi:hypothetical protein